MASEQTIWNNLKLLQGKNPFSSFKRQRSYMEQLLKENNVVEPERRQNVLKYFNLEDERKPADTSYEDSLSGSFSRAMDVGGEGIEQIYEGISAMGNVALGRNEAYLENIKAIRESKKEAGKVSAVQDRLNPNSKFGRFMFDVTANMPVMVTALAGSGAAAKLLTTIAIPKYIAGLIGYAAVDSLMESGANFGDVLTDPRMTQALKEILKRDPTDEDLMNINDGVGKLLKDKAVDSAQNVAILNFVNPTNLVESRLKLLGGKTLKGRLVKRAGLEGAEEGLQSIASQRAREQAISEVSPSTPDMSITESLGAVDYGQAGYEATLGAFTGTAVSLPQTYMGLKAERADQEQKEIGKEQDQILIDEFNDAAKLETKKRLFGNRVRELVAAGDFKTLDAFTLNRDESERDIILGEVEKLKLSQDARVAKNAINYRPGTHIKEEVQGDGQTDAKPMDMDWQFKEEYDEAIEAEKNGIADPRQQFLIRYAKNVQNPKLGNFVKSWAIAQRNMKDKNQPNQTMDTGQPTGQQQQTQPQPQSQPQSQPQPASTERIQQATQDIQESLEQAAPEVPEAQFTPEEMDKDATFKEVRDILVLVIGDSVDKSAVSSAVTKAQDTVPVVEGFKRISLRPGKPGSTREGMTVKEQNFTLEGKKIVAATAVKRLVTQGLISPQQETQILQRIDPDTFGGADRTIPIEGSQLDMAQPEGEAELQQVYDQQLEQTEIPVEPEQDLGNTIEEQDARSLIRSVIVERVPKVRAHVERLMRADKENFDDSAITNSQIIDGQADLFNTNLVNEYLSAVKEIEGVEPNAIPEKFVNQRTVRKVFQEIFKSGGAAFSLRPKQLQNLGTPEEMQARKEFYKEFLTNPDYVLPNQLDRSQYKNLSGGQAATDDKGMAFIDKSTEQVILRGGSIPEGTRIRVTSATSKDRIGKTYTWTGRKSQAGDREPGIWYLSDVDGNPIVDTEKAKLGGTFDRESDPFLRDDLWQEIRRVNPDDKMGLDLASAYLQLTDNPDQMSLTGPGGSIYQLPGRGPGAEMPDPQGVGSVRGRLSPEDKEMQDRIRDNNRTIQQFEKANRAIEDNNSEKLADVERANDELFSQKGFDIDSSFSEDGLSFVVTADMAADPNFGALVTRLGLQEQSRQPVGNEGDNIVTYGPPERIKMPKFERDTSPQEPDAYEAALEEALTTGRSSYGQGNKKVKDVPERYTSLMKKRGSGKRSPEDIEKAVDAMPDWLKETIKANPKVSVMTKQEMINLITSDQPSPADEITLPDVLRPKETDTERVVDAKNKIINAIWEASSTEYDTTRNSPGVRYSNMPKLWMVMKVLQDPKTASDAIQKYIGFENAAYGSAMSIDQMENELMMLDTLIETQAPSMREALEEAIQVEMIANEQLASLEEDYASIMEEYDRARTELEARAIELSPEQYAAQAEDIRIKLIEGTNAKLAELDISGASQEVRDAKTRVEELTFELAELMGKFDTLGTRFEEAKAKAKEEATQGIYFEQNKQAKKDAEIAAIRAKKGKYPDQITIKESDRKASNSYPLGSFVTDFVKQIRFRMKGRKVPKEEINKVTDKKVLPWLENWLLENPNRILGKMVKQGETKLYPDRPRTSTGDLSQWVIDLADTYIQEETQSPIMAGKARGETGFSAADVLGNDYKKPSESIDIDDFAESTLLPDQIQGQYQLDADESSRFANQMSTTDWWGRQPDGLSIDNIVSTQSIEWTTPAENKSDPRVLPKDHAMRFIYDALVKSGIPKKKLDQDKTAQRMYTDLKDLAYDYLKGLASYGQDSVLEANRSALRTGLINNKQFEAIDSIASNNTDSASKKKL